MRRQLLAVALMGMGASGCTAMGAWLYQDPTYALRAVNIRPGAAGAERNDSLELTFIGCNLNDYDLTETSFQTRMEIAGARAGEVTHSQTLFIATRDTARFTVVMPLREGSLPSKGAANPFEIVGTSSLETPIGQRSVNVRFAGRVEVTGETFTWSTRADGCRPGTSVLPASFDTRPVIRDDPSGRPNQPQPGMPGGQPGRPQ